MQQNGNIFVFHTGRDEKYQDLRKTRLEPLVVSPKGLALYGCLEKFFNKKPIFLSWPPKSLCKSEGRWIPETQTTYWGYTAHYCANWDIPKWRMVLPLFFFTRLALRQVQSGDVVLLKNFEFIHVFACLWLAAFKDVRFVIDYADGKYLMEHGIFRMLNIVSDWIGRKLVTFGILAHPGFRERLAPHVQCLVLPGFVEPKRNPVTIKSGQDVRFLYSGGLNEPRGVHIILQALDRLPLVGWQLDITGSGPLEESVLQRIKCAPWKERVRFHGALNREDFEALLGSVHVGLNCQQSSNRLCGAMFPSKVFEYLSFGLIVLSSRASAVPEICGNAVAYYDNEADPASLAGVMAQVIGDPECFGASLDRANLAEFYSLSNVTQRLRLLFGG